MTAPLIHKLALTVLLCALASAASAAQLPLRYVDEAAIADGGVTIVDARPAALCEAASLPGARCLPAEDFLSLHGRLAGFANIAWVLGSAGLSGDEKVLVAGGNPVRRDFVAGLLYIMGQKDISVLTTGISQLKVKLAAGEARGMLREQIWQAAARDQTLVFVNELKELLTSNGAQMLYDGRGEQAYWGKEIRAARGGHLPGAEHLPASVLRADIARGSVQLPPPGKNAAPIVYGRGPVDGIAYMTLIMAGTGSQIRVFPGGWAKWAANGALPADAETHPARLRKPAGQADNTVFSRRIWAGAAAGLLLGGGLVITALWAHKRRKAV